MARTKGAKGNPKDPQKELDRVKKMFVDQKIPFPGDPGGSGTPKELVDPGKSEVQDTTFSLGEKEKNQTYQCGNCKTLLYEELSICPNCGVKLTWT